MISFRAATVEFVVDYGLAHRSLEGVTEIGVDEIAFFKGQFPEPVLPNVGNDSYGAVLSAGKALC